MNNNCKLALINLIDFSYTFLTEKQFYKKLLAEITRNTIIIQFADNQKDFFIKWYQKKYNQSRRNYILYTDIYNHQIKEIPYSFGWVDKQGLITLLDVEEAYYLFDKHHSKTILSYTYYPKYHKQRFAYRNAPTKHTSEKYYAKLADTRFDKSLNQPSARGGHQKNLSKSYYDEWELETRSECGNWKRDTKLRHQYLVNVVKKNRSYK